MVRIPARAARQRVRVTLSDQAGGGRQAEKGQGRRRPGLRGHPRGHQTDLHPALVLLRASCVILGPFNPSGSGTSSETRADPRARPHAAPDPRQPAEGGRCHHAALLGTTLRAARVLHFPQDPVWEAPADSAPAGSELGCPCPRQGSAGWCQAAGGTTSQGQGSWHGWGQSLKCWRGEGQSRPPGPCLLWGPTPAGKEGAWLNPGRAGGQACWSRPVPQALVGP